MTKTYANDVQALKDVTLTIPVGMYGLPDKSTLICILATLQEPDEGSIRLGTTDMLKQKDEVRSTLGYLPQEFGVYPRASTPELLCRGAMRKDIAEHRARTEVVEAHLRQTNLWEVRQLLLALYVNSSVETTLVPFW